ncbi:Gp49 family protein [Erwinia aphidicola]|uniref:Gp49 family protein n=1 Tax=Erwinia aphidicola TaxID=68334 RepID=UPI0030D474A4
MNDQDIEQQIQDAGKTAPRVTPDQIASVIVSEVYFSAANGLVGANKEVEERNLNPINETQELDNLNQLELLTFCVLVLSNGFTVTGESACASPENFDAEIGRKIARENAVNKVWMLEGYLLKQKLSEG